MRETLKKELALLIDAEKWGYIKSWFSSYDSEEERAHKCHLWGYMFMPEYLRAKGCDAHLELIKENLSDKNEYTAFPRGMAKDLWIETPILTNKGFKKLKDVEVGDKIFGEDGEQTNVIKKSEIFNRDCYKVVFSDGSEIIAGATHDWCVEDIKIRQRKSDHVRYKTKNPKKSVELLKLTTEELSKNLFIKRNDGRYEVNYSIPVCEPVKFLEKIYEVEPYFLGLWLGDGASDGVGITNVDEEVVEYLYGYADRLGLKVSKPEHITYRITGDRTGTRANTLQGRLRSIGVLGKKHIPGEYQLGSVEQRLELLRGLMDSDGTISKTGHCSFTNTNERLVDDVLKLLWSLGIKATKRDGTAKIYGVECGKYYKIAFTTDLDVFKIERKKSRLNISNIRTKRRYIVAVDKVDSVPTQCLGIDNESHLFLAGHELIPTHNTTINQLCISYEVASGTQKFIPIIEKSWEEATNVLEGIREVLDTQLVRQVYGKMVGRTVDGEEAERMPDAKGDVFINGVRLRALGFNRTIRGLKTKAWRPTKIYVDDVEEDEHIGNPEQRKKYLLNYTKGIIPSVDRDGCIKVRGTILHYDSLLMSLINQHDGKIYKAFDKYDPKNTLLWEDYWDYDRLMQKKKDMESEGYGVNAFYQEYLNEPISEEARDFKWDWLTKTYTEDDLKYKNVNLFACIDVADATGEGRDYTGVIVEAIDDQGFWYNKLTKRYRKDILGLVDLIFELWAMPGMRIIGVEKRAFQDQIKPLLEKETETRGSFPHVVELKHGGKRKYDRIKGALQGLYRLGKILNKETPEDDTKLLWDELYSMGGGVISAKNDDLADAKAYIAQIAEMPIGVEYKKRYTQIKNREGRVDPLSKITLTK